MDMTKRQPRQTLVGVSHAHLERLCQRTGFVVISAETSYTTSGDFFDMVKTLACQ
jgi:hypothetical protein